MAQLILIGTNRVEITFGTVDEELVTATCIEHDPSDGRVAPPGACSWTENYDTTDDAIAGGEQHADGVR